MPSPPIISHPPGSYRNALTYLSASAQAIPSREAALACSGFFSPDSVSCILQDSTLRSPPLRGSLLQGSRMEGSHPPSAHAALRLCSYFYYHSGHSEGYGFV